MVCTAVEMAWSRALMSADERHVCRARASVSRITMTVCVPRPCEKLVIQPWYWFRSGAPPALAPPQSRLGISYTEKTGTWPAEFAPFTYVNASFWTVLGLNEASQRAAGWLPIRVRITAARESFGFAAA